ncbi:aldehyde dehydrogenase family protein [Roseibacillus ishigakijimensis]|uniref:Aldehyde dehydrogenase n=2 Tax=Roseibacillus ishigakijimensis TaxID=454146 RepID=A0A934RTV2_9BACT|nr:aldehyde dehydrogenase family protein [Roseibacillus ishigakijimensis]
MTETPPAQQEQLIAEQQAFFRAGRTRSLDDRLAILTRFETVLRDHQEELLRVLAADLGKPTLEAFLSEYHFVLQEIRLMRKCLRRWLQPRSFSSPLYFWPCRNEVRREPHGNTLLIAPWNYPVQLALGPLLGAVAAGNTVILKPSEEAPATAAFLERVLAEIFPPGWVAVVQGGKEVTHSLLQHRFDFLFFTGSSRVGRIVAGQAARHLTPHVLELGGKCPCVVDGSADLTMAAKRILTGKLFNAGQTCFAPDFVAVEEAVAGELQDELTEWLTRLPWEKELARIVNRKHYERLQGLLKGNEIGKGCDQPDELGMAPRLVPGAQWGDDCMKEEIFGPILPLVSYRDESELYARLSSYPEPLALYCFSKDKGFVERLVREVPSGGVCVNDVGKQASNPNGSFGGKGESGYGRYRGEASVRAFTYERTYSRRYFFPDPFASLPPRDKQTRLLRKWLK